MEHLKVKGWAFYWSIKPYTNEIERIRKHLSNAPLINCKMSELNEGDYFRYAGELEFYRLGKVEQNTADALDLLGNIAGIVLLSSELILKVND